MIQISYLYESSWFFKIIYESLLLLSSAWEELKGLYFVRHHYIDRCVWYKRAVHDRNSQCIFKVIHYFIYFHLVYINRWIIPKVNYDHISFKFICEILIMSSSSSFCSSYYIIISSFLPLFLYMFSLLYFLLFFQRAPSIRAGQKPWGPTETKLSDEQNSVSGG